MKGSHRKTKAQAAQEQVGTVQAWREDGLWGGRTPGFTTPARRGLAGTSLSWNTDLRPHSCGKHPPASVQLLRPTRGEKKHNYSSCRSVSTQQTSPFGVHKVSRQDTEIRDLAAGACRFLRAEVFKPHLICTGSSNRLVNTPKTLGLKEKPNQTTKPKPNQPQRKQKKRKKEKQNSSSICESGFPVRL